jgi:hypothetical protein
MKSYSNRLKVCVAGLCEIQVNERAMVDELYQWLKPFHK